MDIGPGVVPIKEILPLEPLDAPWLRLYLAQNAPEANAYEPGIFDA